jgi:hypothetical protein
MDFAKISNHTIEIYFVLFYFGQRLYIFQNLCVFNKALIFEATPYKPKDKVLIFHFKLISGDIRLFY